MLIEGVIWNSINLWPQITQINKIIKVKINTKPTLSIKLI